MFAFTLSEVLITLVIIGIIAGLTVPVLIQYHKRVETASRLKKTYSALAQAIKLAETESGIPALQWEYFSTSLAWEKISKYLSTTEKEDVKYDSNSTGTLYIFGDGTTIYLSAGFGCLGDAHGYVADVNGEKGPNAWGRDRFTFCHHRYIHVPNDYPNAKTLEPAKTAERLRQTNPITREQLLDDCKKEAYYCSSLIMYDGWEIKSDYPYKL